MTSNQSGADLGRQDGQAEPRYRRHFRGIKACANARTHERVAAWLADLPQGSRVLDLPAGRGALTLRLAELGLDVVGADLFPETFEAPGLVCHQADMSAALPFPDAGFDALACVEGIEHIENAFSFAREANRVLRPGGRLIITTPNILRAFSRLRFLLTVFYSLNRRPLNEFADDPVHDHISPKSYPQLHHILHTSGFAIQQVICNRLILADAWFYPLYPAAWLWTTMTMRGEPYPQQPKANAVFRRHMLSPALLMGKVILIRATKVKDIKTQ